MRQMLRTLPLAVMMFCLLTWTFAVGAGPSDPPPASSASALSVGGDPVLYDETDGDSATFQRDFDEGYAQGDVTIGYIAVTGSADGDEATSRVDVTDLSLIDGRVTLDSLAMAVSAGPGGSGGTEAAASGGPSRRNPTVVIDASRPIDVVQSDIREAVTQAIG